MEKSYYNELDPNKQISQSFTLFKNSKIKNSQRNGIISSKTQKKNFTQQSNEFKDTKSLSMFSENKYSKMLKEMSNLNELRHLNIDLADEKTLYEQMHLQTKYPLDTSNEKLNELFQLNQSENSNDTFELFYTKNYTITPLLYRIIISMTSPDIVGELNLGYCNQKVLIFNYTNIFEKDTFDKEFLKPFFHSTVLPELKKEYDSSDDYNENEYPINYWLEEYSNKVYNNIFIVNYTNLTELFFKIQNLPIFLKQLKEISLIILDSPNLLINQSVGLNYESESLAEETVNYKTTVAFNKKKRKSLKTDEKNIYEIINNLINNFQKEFNFNLIITLYDFERLLSLNYLKYRAGDENFMFNISNNFLVNVDPNSDRSSFMFQLKDFRDRHKIYSLEPIESYVNFNCNVFGYIIYIRENIYEFRAYFKKDQFDQIILLHSLSMNYCIQHNHR